MGSKNGRSLMVCGEKLSGGRFRRTFWGTVRGKMSPGIHIAGEINLSELDVSLRGPVHWLLHPGQVTNYTVHLSLALCSCGQLSSAMVSLLTVSFCRRLERTGCAIKSRRPDEGTYPQHLRAPYNSCSLTSFWVLLRFHITSAAQQSTTSHMFRGLILAKTPVRFGTTWTVHVR